MSDFIPKPSGAKIGGLGPKAQKLQAALAKAQAKSGDKPQAGAAKTSSFAGKKTSFNRKAV
jgi:hypothetical protein